MATLDSMHYIQCVYVGFVSSRVSGYKLLQVYYCLFPIATSKLMTKLCTLLLSSSLC